MSVWPRHIHRLIIYSRWRGKDRYARQQSPASRKRPLVRRSFKNSDRTKRENLDVRRKSILAGEKMRLKRDLIEMPCQQISFYGKRFRFQMTSFPAASCTLALQQRLSGQYLRCNLRTLHACDGNRALQKHYLLIDFARLFT